MALSAGTRLGPYEILAPLGAGGMGEVYRATDTKLGREVAIKTLPPEVTGDSERLARFQREAQLLASLNHPHIASIYGLEEADGKPFLVLELVEGEDLAERLKRGAIPMDEALEVARQIAEGLEEAHEKGIVHRDLKPANVKVTPDGKVKVLDFGLAKAWEGDAAIGSSSGLSQSPTLAHSGTQAGVILGTAAYMSPEQARGDAVDKQADIWAFGVVLFEMLTGRRLFEGRTISDVLASVLKDEPPWSQLPGDLPPGVERVLRRCLARDARDRFRDAGDIMLALEDASAERAPGPTRSPASSWRFAALLLVFAVAVGAVARHIGLRPESPRLRRGTIPVSGLVTARGWPTISPDGRKIAYLTGEGLWLHSLDSFDPVRIYEGEVMSPFFSWDSDRIAFSGDAGGLWQLGVDGSAKRLICEIPSVAEGVWLADDSIIFSAGSYGMFRVPASGGQPVPIEEGIETRGKSLEFVLPGDGRYGFVDYRAGTIEMLSDGSWTTLASEPDLVAAAYSKTGHLIYHRAESGMWALPFDDARGMVTGGAFQIDPLGGSPSFSDAGRLVYPRGRDRSELVRVDRDGTVRDVIGTAQYMLQDPSLSPDGRWIAVFSREQGHYATWLHEIGGSVVRRLTFDIEPTWMSVAWAPDGNVYIPARDGGIWRKHFSGSSPAERVVDGTAPHVSSDARTLAYREPIEESRAEPGVSPRWVLQYVDLVDGGAPRVFLTGDDARGHPRFSPDGKWLAYASGEAGRTQVFIRRFPTGEGPWQVSTDGGLMPRWSAEGDEVFFVQGQQLMGARVRTEPSMELEPPETLFDLFAPWFKEYEVYGDGFVLVRPTDEISQIAVVDNWELGFGSESDR